MVWKKSGNIHVPSAIYASSLLKIPAPRLNFLNHVSFAKITTPAAAAHANWYVEGLVVYSNSYQYIYAIFILRGCVRACMWICLHVQSPTLYVHSLPRTSVCLCEYNLFTSTVNILHLAAQEPRANVFVFHATLNKVHLILSFLILSHLISSYLILS